VLVQSAIKSSSGRVYTGRRHHNIINYYALQGIYFKTSDDIQGFVNDRGVFKDRRLAMVEAIKCKQLRNGKIIGGVLTSEDLW